MGELREIHIKILMKLYVCAWQNYLKKLVQNVKSNIMSENLMPQPSQK